MVVSTSCQSDDDRDTWDVAIGQLITGLDADIEKSGAASHSPPLLPPPTTTTTLGGTTTVVADMGAAGAAKNRQDSAATLHEKGLKMKIKRTACRTGNAADAKHEIVSTSEASATCSSGGAEQVLVPGAAGDSLLPPSSAAGDERILSRRVTAHRKDRRGREGAAVKSEEERWENGESASAVAVSLTDGCDQEMLDSAAKRIRKTDSLEEFADVSVGTDDAMVSRGTSIDPECLGPCEPGTSVSLEGIVWQETECGVLVVNITWRGKTYVGTLLDCTRQQDWAPPRFTDSPTVELDLRSAKARAKRGRSSAGGGAQTDGLPPGSVVGLAGGLGANVAETRASKLRAAPHSSGGAKGRRGAYSNGTTSTAFSAPNSPARRKGRIPVPSALATAGSCESSSVGAPVKSSEVDSDDVESISHNNNVSSSNGATALIECPEAGCAKKFRHTSALLYHQSHAHHSAIGEPIESATGPTSSEDVPEHTVDTVREEEETSPVAVTAAAAPVAGECDTGVMTAVGVVDSCSSASLPGCHSQSEEIDGHIIKKESESLLSTSVASVISDTRANISGAVADRLSCDSSVPVPGSVSVGDATVCKLESDTDTPLSLTVQQFNEPPVSPAYSDISDDTTPATLPVTNLPQTPGTLHRIDTVPSSSQSLLNTFRKRPLSPEVPPSHPPPAAAATLSADVAGRLPFYPYQYRLPVPPHSQTQPVSAHFSVAGLLEPSRYGAPGPGPVRLERPPVSSPCSPRPGPIRVSTAADCSPQLSVGLRVPMSTAGFSAPFTASFVGLPPPHGTVPPGVVPHGGVPPGVVPHGSVPAGVAVGFPPVLMGNGGGAPGPTVYHPRFPAVLAPEDLSRPGANYGQSGPAVVEPSPSPVFPPVSAGLDAVQRCRRPLGLQQSVPPGPRVPSAPTPPFSSAVPVTVTPPTGFLSK